MTGSNRTLYRRGGFAIAVVGLLIELVGFNRPAFLGGKSILVGSFVVLAGILIFVLAGRKASA